jgi:AraC-like DNA-binding protein
MEPGAWVNQLGPRFGRNGARVVTTGASQLRVTDAPNDSPDLGKTCPIRPEDAFLVDVMARDCLPYDPRLDNKSVSPTVFPTEITVLRHMRRDSIAELRCPSVDLSFYLSRTALDEIVDHIRERRVRALYFRHGRAYDDPIMGGLSQALLPALAKPDQFNTLFVEHLGRALRAYIAHAYGEMQSTPPRARGGLAPWQVRRAKDLLLSKSNGEMPLAQLARKCGLSASHFARAFRQSLGMAPHQWLLSARVERAKDRLLNFSASLAEIAIDCGFADQSHFTRVFTKQIGVSPGQWRRQNAAGPMPDVSSAKSPNHLLQ